MSTTPPRPRPERASWRGRAQALDLPRWGVHLGALLPALWMLAAGLRGALTVNPLQALEQQTGRAALTLLVLSLACTPANSLFGWRAALRHRRTLGLYAFVYASAHLFILVGLDYGFALRLLRADLSGKPFIWVGAASLLILAALAATSFTVWKKRLRRNWKRLHRASYLAVVLAVIHFAWARKGDLTGLSGDILLPLAYGAAALALLALRLPPVRRRLAHRGAPAAPPAREATGPSRPAPPG